MGRVRLGYLALFILLTPLPAAADGIGGSIAGTITTRRGDPIPDVCATAWPVDGEGYGEDITDASGSYRIDGLSAGRYEVSIYACSGDEYLYEEVWFGEDDGILVREGEVTAGIDASLRVGELDVEHADEDATELIEGGGSEAYTVRLPVQPLSDVVVEAEPDGESTVEPSLLLFTPENWSVPQTLAVTAVDDDADDHYDEWGDGNGTAIEHAVHSADPMFDGMRGSGIWFWITDNDGAAKLTSTGPAAVPYGRSIRPSVELTDQLDGDPLGGRELRFRVHGDGIDRSAIAVTEPDGAASVDLGSDLPLGSYVVEVSFAGDEFHAPASLAEELEVQQAVTRIIYTGPSSGIRGTSASLKAKLVHDDGVTPIPGRTLRFSLGGFFSGTAITNASGEATVTTTLSAMYGSYPLDISFDGDAGFVQQQHGRSFSIAWSNVFSAGGTTISLNTALKEFRVVTTGADSGVVAATLMRVDNGGTAVLNLISVHHQDAGVALHGEFDTRFGNWGAAGRVGLTPFEAHRIP